MRFVLCLLLLILCGPLYHGAPKREPCLFCLQQFSLNIYSCQRSYRLSEQVVTATTEDTTERKTAMFNRNLPV